MLHFEIRFQHQCFTASCHTRHLNFIVSTPAIRNILQVFERQYFYMRSSAVENCKPWYLFFQGLPSAFNTPHVSGLSAKMPLSPPMCIYLALHHTFTSASLCFLNGSKSILKNFMQKLSDLNQYKNRQFSDAKLKLLPTASISAPLTLSRFTASCHTRPELPFVPVYIWSFLHLEIRPQDERFSV